MIIIFNRMLFLLLCFAGYACAAEKRLTIGQGGIAVSEKEAVGFLAVSSTGNTLAVVTQKAGLDRLKIITNQIKNIGIYEKNGNIFSSTANFEQKAERTIKAIECTDQNLAVIIRPNAGKDICYYVCKKNGIWENHKFMMHVLLGVSIEHSLIPFSHQNSCRPRFVDATKIREAKVGETDLKIEQRYDLIVGSKVYNYFSIKFCQEYYLAYRKFVPKKVHIYKLQKLSPDIVKQLQKFPSIFYVLRKPRLEDNLEDNKEYQMLKKEVVKAPPFFSLTDNKKISEDFLPINELFWNNIALHDIKPLVAYASPGNKLTIIDFVKNELVKQIKVGAAITSVAFHPEKPIVACGDESGTISMNHIERQKLMTKSGHTGSVNSIVFDAQNNVFSGGQDGIVRRWKLPRRKWFPITNILYNS